MPKPWEKYGGSAPSTIVAAPQYRIEQDARDEARKDAADDRADRRDKRAADEAERRARIDGQRLDIERKRLELTEAGQTGAKLTAKERSDAIAGFKSGEAVERLVADLEKLYPLGPGGTSGISGIQDYLPLTANQRFDSAGNAARGNVGSALGFTGGQLNTATEAAQAVGPYLPQAGDRDEVILDKIARLRKLAEDAKSRSTQILGGVPDANGRVTPVEAQPQPAPQAAPAAPAPVPTGVAPTKAARRSEGGDFTSAAGIKMAQQLAAAYRGGADIDQLNSLLTQNGFQPFTDPGVISRIGKREPLQFAPPRVDDTRSGASKALSGLADGSVGAYALAALNSGTAGYLDELTGGQTQMAKDYAAANFPGATFAGNVTGTVAASGALGRAVQGAGAVSPVARLLLGSGTRAGVTADGLYGAAYGSGENNDNRLLGSATGVAANLAGNAVGTYGMRAIGAGVRGVSDPAVRYLTERGIPLSIGQTVGNRGFLGKTINKLESLPYIGEMIGARRGDSVKAFNVAAVNDALAPIGATVKGEAGQAAIGEAQDAISRAYGDALSGVNVFADPQFMSELSAAVTRGRAVPVQGEQFGHLMDTRFAPLFGPGVSLDGAGAQAAMQTVRGGGAQFAKEGAMGSLVADELANIDASVASLLARQAPEAAEGLANANASYSALQPINAAATTSVNGEVGSGIFSPAQLNRAVAQNTRQFGGKAAAARGAKQTDLMRYAQEVIPSTVPNSGTADRGIAALLLPAALGGTAYGVSDMSPATAAVLAALAGGSTKAGGAAIQAALVKRSDAAKRIGQLILDHSRIAGTIGASSGTAVTLQ